jgi:hypoxanthine phosphoribosyltransferase
MMNGPAALLSAEEISGLVSQIAAKIDADHPEGVTIVGVLKGCVFFMADLVRALKVPCTADFLALSAYSPGAAKVRVLKDLDRDVEGEDVVIVADIVDTGLSIRYAVDLVEARGARHVRVCSLLDRPARRIVPVPLAYLGLETDIEFLVGYGLDFAERYRNLPEVVEVDPNWLRDEGASFEQRVFVGVGAFSEPGSRE